MLSSLLNQLLLFYILLVTGFLCSVLVLLTLNQQLLYASLHSEDPRIAKFILCTPWPIFLVGVLALAVTWPIALFALSLYELTKH